MSVTFDYKPWKVKLQITPKKPVASLMSLYDLIADDTGSPRASVSYSAASGAALAHDLIYYNAKFWSTTGTIEAAETLDDWELLGIDMGPVKYDSRAKHKTITIPSASRQYFDSSTQSYIMRNKTAALYPDTADELYLAAEHGWDTTSAVTAYGEANAFTVGTTETAFTADILLTDADTTFNATLVNVTGVSGYTGLLLNVYNSANARLFVQRMTGIIANTLIKAVFENKNESVITCLKNTYVWVRTSFFGDYIDPDSFNQDLTSESDVVHKNLMLSGSGDFNRYDGISTTPAVGTTNYYKKKRTESTRPYIPQTSPSVDLLSNRILSGYTSMTDTELNTVLTDGIFNDSVGSVKTEPVSRAMLSTLHTIYPATFLDPESKRTAEDYKGDRPTLLPLSGTDQIDGRILSPTIDELWHYIKRLVSGRSKDSDTVKTDTGYIYQKDTDYKNEQDTYLNQPTDFHIPVDFTGTVATYKRGDPLESVIKSVDNSGNEDAVALVVSYFVNAPQSFKFNLFEQLKDLHNMTVSFNDIGYVQNLPVDQSAGARTSTLLTENSAMSSGDWSPRTGPLSLRELEVSILELKFNLIYAFKEINNNFATVGLLGKNGTNADKPNENFGGSLYMMHKSYNGNRSNPNTWYSPNGDNTGSDASKGAKAVYSDIKDLDSTGARKFLAENYGTGSEIPEDQGTPTSAYTFLAADGNWRTMEHNRLPILDEEY